MPAVKAGTQADITIIYRLPFTLSPPPPYARPRAPKPHTAALDFIAQRCSPPIHSTHAAGQLAKAKRRCAQSHQTAPPRSKLPARATAQQPTDPRRRVPSHQPAPLRTNKPPTRATAHQEATALRRHAPRSHCTAPPRTEKPSHRAAAQQRATLQYRCAPKSHCTVPLRTKKPPHSAAAHQATSPRCRALVSRPASRSWPSYPLSPFPPAFTTHLAAVPSLRRTLLGIKDTQELSKQEQGSNKS